MSKKGLRDAYKKLEEMYKEDEVKVQETEIDYGEQLEHYNGGLFFDEFGNAYNANGSHIELYLKQPEELEESDENLQVILEAARKHSRDYEEQIKFAINAIAANRDKVIVSYSTLYSILDIFPDESKLGKLIEKHPIVSGAYEDIWTDWLGTTFKQAGKSLDELPEQMLTDKWFMMEYLTSTEEKNKEFLNQGYMDWPEGFSIKDAMKRAIDICDDEIDK